MKMLTDCSGPCLVCECTGGCAAGRGDDHFMVASRVDLLERLNTGRWGGTGRLLTPSEMSEIETWMKDTYGDEDVG